MICTAALATVTIRSCDCIGPSWAVDHCFGETIDRHVKIQTLTCIRTAGTHDDIEHIAHTGESWYDDTPGAIPHARSVQKSYAPQPLVYRAEIEAAYANDRIRSKIGRGYIHWILKEAAQARKKIRTLLTDNDVTGVHNPRLCEGRGCVAHHPSDHHMNTWPVIWRNDRGFSERMCEHGIGHPDPDDLDFFAIERPHDSIEVHGCDGCCRKKEPLNESLPPTST